MPQTYDYKVRDRSGTLITGQLAGDSETLVLQRLREMGMTPVEVKKANAGLKMEINLRPGRVKLKQIAVFCRQFATMVNSGLPILRALSILGDQTESKELAKVLVQTRTDVEQGASLSNAMVKHPKAFNNLYVSMVRSGETGGSLDSTLLRLAEMIEREVQLRGKIKSAMTYPIAVVALVMLIMSAMLLFVVPQFKGIYGQLGGTLPLPTRAIERRAIWAVFGAVVLWASSSLTVRAAHSDALVFTSWRLWFALPPLFVIVAYRKRRDPDLVLRPAHISRLRWTVIVAGAGALFTAGATTFASPKSRIFTRPSRVTQRFSGFMSRCTIPLSCAAARPRAIWIAHSTALDAGSGPPARRARSVSPSSNSKTT